MTPLQRWQQLPGARRRLLLEAGAALLRAAWRVRRWPFVRLVGQLGTLTAPGAAPVTCSVRTEDQRVAQEIRWAMGTWLRHWPLSPTCLMQAVAAGDLLLRRGLSCRLYLGVKTGALGSSGQNSGLGAHAWLECQGILVTGASEAQCFKPIAVCLRQAPRGGADA